jgi:pentatricopeptide repeat protein
MSAANIQFALVPRVLLSRSFASLRASSDNSNNDDDGNEDDGSLTEEQAQAARAQRAAASRSSRAAPVAFIEESGMQRAYHLRIMKMLETGNFAAANELYEEMQADGVKPSAETRVELIFYSPVISDALDFLTDMNRSGDRPSVAVCVCRHFRLIAFEFVGNNRETESSREKTTENNKQSRVADKMLSDSTPHMRIRYNEILRRCAECKLEYTATRLLREMERLGVEPDVNTYCLVIRTIGACFVVSLCAERQHGTVNQPIKST